MTGEAGDPGPERGNGAAGPAARAGGGLGDTIRSAAAGEELTAASVLRAMGGIRGIVESVLPGLAFLAVYAFTLELVPSLVAPAAIGVLAIVVRLVRREPLLPAIAGLLGTVVCAALSLWTGRAQEYFVPGFWLNGAYLVGLVLSVVVGWPVVGLIVGFLMNDGTRWRARPRVRRLLSVLTLVWAAIFALRLAVQVPLYLAGDPAVTWLAATRLLMGVPLFGLMVVITWLVVRAAYVVERRAEDDEDDKLS